ncbi:MAG: YbhB/YbcL family Raf kinase inhibitor-like protein [Bacteroidia bacterium]|nr:YbhB/YbcL family Raf kinase inhibitor-like protein [Bacteroidia bacterium]
MRWLWLSTGAWLQAQMQITIEGYKEGDLLGREYTCDGANVPPTLTWQGAPPETQAYVIRMYDPDAPADTFIHWIVYNYTGTSLSLQTKGLAQGYNDFGNIGYGGPCPPSSDPAHRYVIEVYALRKPLGLSSPPTWDKLLIAMKDKVAAHASTYVRYKRQKR